jgi:integrase/recombinase XerD
MRLTSSSNLDRISFAICFIFYLNDVELMKSKGTYDFYRQYLGYLNGYFENKELESINKHLVTFKTMYKYITEKSFKYAKLKENKQIIQTVRPETIKRIFKHGESRLHTNYAYRNHVFLRLLLDTGLRMNELINVKIKNIDFRDNSILVQITKTHADRYVMFTEETSKHLRKFITLFVYGDDLFYDFKTGNQMTVTAVETFIYRLKNRLGIKESISPHKWRHTFATTFSRRGGNMEILRLILGHENLKTTQKYLHLNKEDLINNYRDIFQN